MANTPYVMLVGEEQVIEATLKVKFQAQGWRVEIVRGGGAALALIRERVPVLIILEAHLHDMEGYVFAQQLKENPETSNISMIVLTSDADTVKTPYLYNTLANSYLHLPFSPTEVTRIAQNIIFGK